jgi:hypothetical protein
MRATLRIAGWLLSPLLERFLDPRALLELFPRRWLRRERLGLGWDWLRSRLVQGGRRWGLRHALLQIASDGLRRDDQDDRDE